MQRENQRDNDTDRYELDSSILASRRGGRTKSPGSKPIVQKRPTRLRSPNKAPVPDRPTLRPAPDRASAGHFHATRRSSDSPSGGRHGLHRHEPPVGNREPEDPGLRNRVIPRVRVELEPSRGGERPLGRALSQKAVVGISATSGSGGRSQSPSCECGREYGTIILFAGCRAHAAAARLPSVHMQTTKFGDSSAGATEARRVAYLLVRRSCPLLVPAASGRQIESAPAATQRKPRLSSPEFRFDPIISSGPARRTRARSVPRALQGRLAEQ